MSKKIIRKEVLGLRQTKFRNSFVNYSSLKSIFKKNFISKNKIIGGYFPVNFEIDCMQVLKKLTQEGYKVSLPVIKKKNKMNFYLWNPNEPLKVSNLGIPEPYKNKKVYPDLILVPIVAYDKKKNRLGYGGGFYDRYIGKFKKKILTIGLAFSFKKINFIKINQFDQKLNYIQTESKKYL